MVLWYVLALCLLFGVVFLLMPKRLLPLRKQLLSITSIQFDEVEHLIQLVSKSKDDEMIEDSLQYQIAKQIVSTQKRRCCTTTLITGGEELGEKSSIDNAHQIQKPIKLTTENTIDVRIKNVFKINNPNETYEEVLDAVRMTSQAANSNDRIICDFTGGNKMMSLGMALAAFGNAKLVYCVDTPGGESPSHYIEINARPMIEEVIEQA